MALLDQLRPERKRFLYTVSAQLSAPASQDAGTTGLWVSQAIIERRGNKNEPRRR